METVRRLAILFFASMLLAAAAGSPLKADENNKLTYFTFSQPVELPGIALPAGTYAFKLLDTAGSRNIVQVYSKDLSHLYGTFLTIADYRQEPSDKTIIRFSETKQGGPPAIKEWFYPGELAGYEFVYPKNRATELAKASNQPVPSMASNMTSNIKQSAGSSAADQSSKGAEQATVASLEKTPVMAEQPSGDEVELAEAFILTAPDSPPSGANTVHNVNSEHSTVAQNLPKTASTLPTLLLSGAFLTMLGVLLRVMAKPIA